MLIGKTYIVEEERREPGREKDEDEEKQDHFPAFFLFLGVYEGSFATVSQLLFFLIRIRFSFNHNQRFSGKPHSKG